LHPRRKQHCGHSQQLLFSAILSDDHWLGGGLNVPKSGFMCVCSFFWHFGLLLTVFYPSKHGFPPFYSEIARADSSAEVKFLYDTPGRSVPVRTARLQFSPVISHSETRVGAAADMPSS